MVDASLRGIYYQPMLGSILIVGLVIGFFVVLAMAPKEAIQIMVSLFWLILGLSVPASLIYAMLR